MYKTIEDKLPNIISVGKEMKRSKPDHKRLVLINGSIINTETLTNEFADIMIDGNEIIEIGSDLGIDGDELYLDCEGLQVWPGLIDMHLHIGDLFEISTQSAILAVCDGVTTALSPGAGNTFMAPALLGAEIDRGMPLNLGVFLGGQNVLSSMLSQEEIIALFQGKLSAEVASLKMSRNKITNQTAPFIIGIKDHMGHFLMSDENIDRIFDITDEAGLIYMSHTQDPEHTLRLDQLSKGRDFHLGHATAAGCGTHSSPEEGIRVITKLCKKDYITGEFVASMLRDSLGTREGLKMTKKSQQIAYDALADGTVKVLVSDGQNQSTMKGFGSTADNIPCILELAEKGIMTLPEAVATMTINPVRLIAKRSGENEWNERMGNLKKGAYANITVVDPINKRAVYTIVNGKISAFEGKLLRNHGANGCWVSKFGITNEMGVGNITLYSTK